MFTAMAAEKDAHSREALRSQGELLEAEKQRLCEARDREKARLEAEVACLFFKTDFDL